MILLYRLLMNLAIPFGLLGLLVRGFKNPQYWVRWTERFGFISSEIAENAPFDLWIHAVSVGEARAAEPLVSRLLENYPNLNILVTTTTLTGSDMVKMMLNEKVAHCYFPYDIGWAMRLFVLKVQAHLVLIMETEIWPNMITAVKKTGSQLVYTNVRLSERSYQGYAKFSSIVKPTLSKVDHFAVQGKLDRKHLELLGVDSKKITETGSIKFDIDIPQNLTQAAEGLRKILGSDRLVWIAGSTREGEEVQLLDSYQKLKQKFPSLLLVIVPRHPERFNTVATKIKEQGLDFVRRTDNVSELKSSVDIYLGDTMGELSLMYASSDVAFVGGSLAPLGGQNILEPSSLGIPVVFGPHMFNFPDISRWAVQEGAGFMVQNSQGLTESVGQLLSSTKLRKEMGSKGLAMIKAHRGALDKNYRMVEKLINR